MKGPKHYQNLVSSYMIYMAHFWLFGYRSWVLGSAAPEPELGKLHQHWDFRISTASRAFCISDYIWCLAFPCG